ncbi:unnamed protein product [Urochloa decumbens]|uniref:Transposase (putative) gypsy type domain-containing protein n=1 Tax=Urochloa decumbens TaxID=240449 RepID=A0ABC9DSJ3_9POAL
MGQEATGSGSPHEYCCLPPSSTHQSPTVFSSAARCLSPAAAGLRHIIGASSSTSLYIIGASSSTLHVDRIRARAPDAGPDGADTDDDAVSGGVAGALSSTVAERFASSFRTQDSLDALCRNYGVPDQFRPILPAGHHRACSPPPPGSVCVYAHALKAGMRLPLHVFFCEALAHFGLAPSQVAPNGWRVMAAFVVLSHSAGTPPSLAVFRHFFSLCQSKLKGWYCFRGKGAAGALFKGLPHSLKGWKDEFFFLRSPMPWPCPVTWGDPSKGSTAEPTLTREEKSVAAKLLRAHGSAVDLKTYLSESNLAAATITGALSQPPPPPAAAPSPRTATSSKGMDPSVYDMMKSMRAAKAAQASGEKAKVVVKSEPGSDATLSGKKRKLAEDATNQGPSRHEPNRPLDHALGSVSGACPLAPPGFSTQKTSRNSARDHGPEPRHVPDVDTAGWEAARQMLQGLVSPSRERAFSAAKPSELVRSSYITMLQVRTRQTRNSSGRNMSRSVHCAPCIVNCDRERRTQAANCVSFSLGYALELEEKLAAREREADALRRELAQAKAGLAEAEKASAGEARSAREAVRAALRRYPHLDPEQLVVPPDGGRPR